MSNKGVELSDSICGILDAASDILEKQATIARLKPHQKLKSIGKLIEELDVEIGDGLEELSACLKKANDAWEAAE